MSHGIFPMNGSEFAGHLGVNERSLRHLIREHGLMPAHPKHARYEISEEDAVRLAADARIAALPRHR